MRNASCADIKCDFKNPPVNNIFRAEARGRASASLSPLIHEYLTYSRSEGPRRPECAGGHGHTSTTDARVI